MVALQIKVERIPTHSTWKESYVGIISQNWRFVEGGIPSPYREILKLFLKRSIIISVNSILSHLVGKTGLKSLFLAAPVLHALELESAYFLFVQK